MFGHSISLWFCPYFCPFALLPFCFLVLLSFFPFVLLPFCLFVFLYFCLFVFLSFCPCLYVFLSRHHSDEMSEGLEVSKVTICVKILKWHPVIDSLTKVRYRAARAAKNWGLSHCRFSLSHHLARPREGWVEIYNVKVLRFSLSAGTLLTCPMEKSFWIWIIYALEGCVRVWP